jgi:hypothetical protein
MHYMVIDTKTFKRVIRFSDISNIIVGLSYLFNNKKMGQFGLVATISSLLGKTCFLQKYGIQDIQDFVIHYFSVMVAIYWYFESKKWEITYKHFIVFVVAAFIVHMMYYIKTKKYVYRSIPIDKLKGLSSYICMLVLLIVVNYGIKEMVLGKPDTFPYRS